MLFYLLKLCPEISFIILWFFPVLFPWETKLYAKISLMMMIMMNCFCGMVDRRKAFSLISSRDHCQRSSSSRISLSISCEVHAYWSIKSSENVFMKRPSHSLHPPRPPPPLGDGGWQGELSHFSEHSYRRDLGQIGALGGNW